MFRERRRGLPQRDGQGRGGQRGEPRGRAECGPSLRGWPTFPGGPSFRGRWAEVKRERETGYLITLPHACLQILYSTCRNVSLFSIKQDTPQCPGGSLKPCKFLPVLRRLHGQRCLLVKYQGNAMSQCPFSSGTRGPKRFFGHSSTSTNQEPNHPPPNKHTKGPSYSPAQLHGESPAPCEVKGWTEGLNPPR